MLLEASKVTKKFGNFVAVDDVDFLLQRGQLKSLIGPNGAGKTTFFNLLTGVLRPTKGKVQFLDDDITNLSPFERCERGIGRSFQITNIFPNLTIRENVQVPLQQKLDHPWNFWTRRNQLNDITDRAEQLLGRVGLEQEKNSEAVDLAYGDKRRLEIAITLATDPEVILLDEPTAGMSSRETEEMTNLIDKISDDHAVILIEHDMDIVLNISDKVVVLHQGTKIAEEDPGLITKDERVQEAYLGRS